MKRVCFYSIATHLGGAERSLVDLLTGLRDASQRGYTPWVLLPKAEGPLIEILKNERISYDVLKMPNRFFKMSREAPISAGILGLSSLPGMGAYLRDLHRLIQKNDVAVIHTTGIKCHGIAGLLAPIFKRPVLWHMRDILRSGVTLASLKILRKACGINVIANSRATAQAFDQRAKIPVIYNGIDGKRFSPQPNGRYRAIWGVGPEVPVIGIIGVLARWKGQLEFLAMARKLLDRGIDARFVIIGSKIYDTTGDEDIEALLHSQIHELGLKNHVHLAGFEKDSALAINGLDMVVHASTRPEPFGRVVVESMACGVPVVASADGGILELVEDGKTGLLFTPGKIEQMAAAVSKLLSERKLQNTIAHNGRENFLRKFTLDAHVNGMLDHYDGLLKKAAR